MAHIGLVLMAGCAMERRVDPTAIGLPAAERLAEGEIVQILTAMSRFEHRGYSVLAERTDVGAAREMAAEILAEQDALARNMGSLSAPASHRLARTIADREAALSAALPSPAGGPATADYLRGMIQQERWFIILMDNALVPSADSGPLRAFLADARQASVSNLRRLRAVRARL